MGMGGCSPQETASATPPGDANSRGVATPTPHPSPQGGGEVGRRFTSIIQTISLHTLPLGGRVGRASGRGGGLRMLIVGALTYRAACFTGSALSSHFTITAAISRLFFSSISTWELPFTPTSARRMKLGLAPACFR